MGICDVHIHRVAVPRIYTTKVAPAGGHGDGKAGSEYVLIEMMADEHEQVSDHAEDVAAALARVKAAVSIPIIEHVADFEDRARVRASGWRLSIPGGRELGGLHPCNG